MKIFRLFITYLFFTPLMVAAPGPARAETQIVPAFADAPLKGPFAAKGIVIWSHGRSLTREDSTAPTPLYIRTFVAAGWDAARFNRPRVEDLLTVSTADLAARVHELKARGYTRIVLAGQSYGGFIALGAARDNPDVHAVIATAPAAYGSFYDSYASWHENGDALFRLLDGIGQTRVLLAFFHGDDYDPGGRGAEARRILEEHGRRFLVLDQPRDLVGHLAANTGLFVRRFAGCLVTFANAEADAPATPCDDSWGSAPSAALAPLPQTDRHAIGATGSSAITGPGAKAAAADVPLGRWYGYYLNGREFLLDVRSVSGSAVRATYSIGPSVDGAEPADRSERKGIADAGTLVFVEPGKPNLTATPTEIGGLTVSWQATNRSGEMTASARRLADF